MKILKVEFENINSYRGKVSIDFTAPEYARSNNQFVISGETAAGKTTILDAISLALYGRTSRLGKIIKGSNNNETSAMEVINRNSGHCCALVEYECAKGQYISEFKVKKAHEKRDGKVQEPAFIITDAITGEVISGGRNADNLAAETETIIGLSYEQFTRCMLIPQGKFDEFLNSDECQKAEMLAALSGTGEYKKVGALLANRQKEIENRYNTLVGIRDSIELLSDEELVRTRRELSEKEDEVARTREIVKEIENSIEIKKKFEAARSNLRDAKNKIADINSKAAYFENLKEETARARNAALCREAYDTLNGNRDEREKVYAESEANNRKLKSRNDHKSEVCSGLINPLKEYEINKAVSETKIVAVKTRLEGKQERLSDIGNKQKRRRSELEKSEKKKEELQRHRDDLEGEHNALLNKLGTLIESKHLVIAKVLRAQLKTGEICPVCGASFTGQTGDCHMPQTGIREGQKASEELVTISDRIDEQEKRISEVTRSIELLDKDISGLEDEIEKSNRETESIIRDINDELAYWKLAVSSDNADRDIEIAGKKLEKEKNILKAVNEDDKEIEILKAKIGTINVHLSELDKKIAESEAQFAAALDQNGFTADTFRKSVRSEEKIRESEREIADYEKKKYAAESELKKADKEWEDLKGEEPGESLEELKNKKIRLENQKDNQSKELNAIDLKLRGNEEKIREKRKQQEKIDALYEEKVIYDEIRKMIGKLDGSDFQRFVQVIALKSLISAANNYLADIMPHYRLEQKEGKVDFILIEEDPDNPGRDIKRGASNISGGERFIVCLSLALGIAEFAGEQGRVDSIFLDEGFGALSGAPLDEVINSLKKLSATGKTLGIITHVETVIDAFRSLEIKAEKTMGGSRLSGPGITYVRAGR